MSLINIGKVIDAGDDLKKLVDACKSFETADDAARALSKFSTASKRLKASALTEALEHMDYDSASKLLDVTDDIVNIGDAAVEASKKTSKLESGFKALGTSIKSFVSAHRVGVGIGTAVAIGTAIYTFYKNYKQNLIDTANAATEAWNQSLSDIQSKIQQYQELKTKLDSGDLSQSETIEIKQQILDLQNQIVAAYGDQAVGIDLVNGKLDEELQKLKDISQQQLKDEADKNLNKNESAYNDAEKEMTKERKYNIGRAFDIGGTTNESYKKVSKDIISIAEQLKSKGINIEKDRDNTVKFTFTGDATQADEVINEFETKVRALKDVYGDDNLVLNNFLKVSSSALEKNNKVLDKYQDNYKSFLEQSLYAQNNGDDAHILNDYADAVSNLNDALNSQDASKIHSAEIALKSATTAKDSFLSFTDNKKFTSLFDEIEEQINTTSQKLFDFNEAINEKPSANNQFKDQSDDLKEYSKHLKEANLDIVDVQDALQRPGFQKGEYYIRKMADAFGLTADNMDVDSIKNFADVLTQAGIIMGSTASSASNLSSEVEELLSRTSLLSEVTDLDANPIFDSIATADENKNAGDDYVKAITYLKEAKEMYDKGLIGTDDFKTRAAYFSPTASDDPANFKENFSKASRYLKDNATGVENFLTDLKKKGYATFTTLSDGTKQWTYDIDDLQQASENMGMGFEFFMDMFGRLEDYGFHNNFVTSVEDGADRITKLSTDLVKEQAKLAEMETTGQYTVTDSDGSTHKEKANQTAIDAQREKVKALQNDIKQTQDAMDQLTKKNADDYNQQVESAKQAINTLKEERDKIKKDNSIYGDNTDNIVGLMDEQIKKWAEDNHITLDADLNIVDDPSDLEDQVEPLTVDVDYTDLIGLKQQAEESLSTVQDLLNANNSKIDLNLNSTDVDNIDDQIMAVSSALYALKNEKGEVDISTPGAAEAISVLSALYAQKQDLTGEVVMSIDTSQLDGNMTVVVSKLQEFHQVYTELQNLNMLKSAGVNVDTTDAENKLNNITNDIQNLNGTQAEILAKVIPDPSSAETIESGIGQVTVDALVNDVKMPESAIKTNATVDYTLGEQDDPKNKPAKVNYALGSQAKPKNMSAKVNYTADLTGLPPTLPPITRYVNYRTNDPLLGGASKASGSFAIAHSSGTAYNVQNYKRLTPAHVAGDVALKQDERALVNEEYLNGHSESIVRDGVWSLIPGGAHLENLKRGDIIFSAKQTDDLLRTGATPGHARAYANGTLAIANAHAGGGGIGNIGAGGSGSKSGASGTKKKSSKSKSKSSDKSTTANTKATNSNTQATEDNTDAQENLQDWISRLCDVSKDWNDSFKNAIDQFEMNYNQNKAIDEYVANSESYKNTLRNSANNYMSRANSLGLSGDYIHKIWTGTMDIENITDENVRDKIEKYTEWYDKARDLNSEIADLNKSIRETKIQKLDNIKDDYDNLVSLSTSISDYNESVSDLSEKLTGVGDANALLRSANAQVAIRQALVNSEAQLNAQLNALVADGTIGMYTDTWNKWQEEINGVKKSIIEADEALNDLKKSIMEVRFNNFTKAIDKLDFQSDMSSAIQDLLLEEGIYDDNVKITSTGYTKLGLLGTDLVNAKQKVADYNEAIRALKENYKQGNISQADFNEQLQEYQKDQMDAVSATKTARDAIIDLIKDGIEKETDAMDELISKRKDDLDKQKEYYDFQKKMNDQSKDMNKVRAQLAALEGDDSLEATAKRRKLESQLKDLQEQYDEDQKDHEKDVVSDAYDKTLEDFKKNQEDTVKELESSLEKQNQAISNALEAVKNNYGDVYETLTKLAEQYNFSLTEDLTSPWTSAETALKRYQDSIGKLNGNISSIDTSKINPSKPSSSATTPTKNESKYVTNKSENGTWINQGGSWWYQHNDGGYSKDDWEYINGAWYKFDREGYMQSGGWQPWGYDSKGNRAWYYLNSNGDMATGWKQDNGKWYYLDASGMMQTGWAWDGKAWYFMDNSGAMVTSQWISGKNGEQYYVTSTGAMATNGYVRSGDGTKYYWVNGQGVWEPQWDTPYPNLNKYKLYYSTGTPKAKNELAFMDDMDGKLNLGSEAMITEKGVLGNWGGNVIFSKEQTQALYNMSNGIFPGMDQMIKNVKANAAPVNITNNVSQGDINLNFGSAVNVEGDWNKNVDMNKFVKQAVSDILSELKTHYGRLK